MGELKQQFDPHLRATVCIRRETFKAVSETADLRQPKWNENQIVLAAAYIPQTGVQVPDKAQQLGARV